MYYNTTLLERNRTWDFQLEKNEVVALGWSLHLCTTQHPLFTSVIQGWGPRASPLSIRYTPHLEDASGIPHLFVSVPRLMGV
eukprot:4297435-Pyramimonas_sp.AAC.1